MTGTQRALRDELNEAGVKDAGQYGAQEISLSQVAKHLDAARDWKRGEITLTALCEAAGWTAPEQPEPEQAEPKQAVTYTMYAMRGESPEANGERARTVGPGGC